MIAYVVIDTDNHNDICGVFDEYGKALEYVEDNTEYGSFFIEMHDIW